MPFPGTRRRLQQTTCVTVELQITWNGFMSDSGDGFRSARQGPEFTAVDGHFTRKLNNCSVIADSLTIKRLAIYGPAHIMKSLRGLFHPRHPAIQSNGRRGRRLLTEHTGRPSTAVTLPSHVISGAAAGWRASEPRQKGGQRQFPMRQGNIIWIPFGTEEIKSFSNPTLTSQSMKACGVAVEGEILLCFEA